MSESYIYHARVTTRRERKKIRTRLKRQKYSMHIRAVFDTCKTDAREINERVLEKKRRIPLIVRLSSNLHERDRQSSVRIHRRSTFLLSLSLFMRVIHDDLRQIQSKSRHKRRKAATAVRRFAQSELRSTTVKWPTAINPVRQEILPPWKVRSLKKHGLIVVTPRACEPRERCSLSP